MSRILSLISRLVPAISAKSLAVVRIALGVGLIGATWIFPDYPASPWPEAWLLATAMCFTLGWYPRATYACFVAGMAVLVRLTLARRGIHDLGMPFVTMVGLLAVPWQDSVTKAQRASRAYGFAVWFPGLMLGLAFVAAAYAKVHRNGLDWVVTGAVRYHFVTDARNTPYGLGVWIASHYGLSVAFSLMAILIESTVIASVVVRDMRWRLMFFVECALLFAGFKLFQGVSWPFWWVLTMTAFLPWCWLDRRSADRTPGPITHVQALIVAAVVTIQVYASYMRIEIEPFMSNFPMYEQTYASTEEYDKDMAWRFTSLVTAEADGAPITDQIARIPDEAKSALLRIAGNDRYGKDGLRLLCAQFSRVPATITLTAERAGFDWRRGVFKAGEPLPMQAVPLRQMCAGPGL